MGKGVAMAGRSKTGSVGHDWKHNIASMFVRSSEDNHVTPLRWSRAAICFGEPFRHSQKEVLR
jgi:hypothetical protein